ncbi:unnamed protein product, partial [Gulo gulo]
MGLAQELGRTCLSTHLESLPRTRQTHRAPFTLLGARRSCPVRGPSLPLISVSFRRWGRGLGGGGSR